MQKILIRSLILIIISCNIFAAPQTMPIPLSGIFVGPNSTNSINLNPLVPGAVYRVNCTLTVYMDGSQAYIALGSTGQTNPKFRILVNNNVFTAGRIDKPNNRYQSLYVTNSGTASTLTFQTLDGSSMRVDGCMALPMTTP